MEASGRCRYDASGHFRCCILTWQSVATHDWAKAEEQGKITKEADIDTNAEGYKVFKEQGCISCHGDNLQGGAAGPSLVDSGLKPDEIKKSL